MRRIIAVILVALGVSFSAGAQPEGISRCRFCVANQLDYGGRRGFWLDLSGSKLADATLLFMVGDGKAFRTIGEVPGFQPGDTYRLKAVVSPEKAALHVNEALVGESRGGWEPASAPLEVDLRPSWAEEQGDWLATVESLEIAIQPGAAGEAERLAFSFPAARPMPLQLIEPGTGQRRSVQIAPGSTVTITATLKFITRPNPRQFAPFVDRYGQCRYADGVLVKEEAELRADIAAEKTALKRMPLPKDRDRYGGSLGLGWGEKPTGFFRVAQHDGYWWLITPEGNPCFYLGIDVFPAQTWEMTPVTGREWLFAGLPARDDETFAPAWGKDVWGIADGTEYFSHYAANLLRKYGRKDWLTRAEAIGILRILSWGFGGAGKWCEPGRYVYVPVLNLGSFALVNGMPDINNPFIRAQIHGAIDGQIKPHKDDPWILGWSVESEMDLVVTEQHVHQLLGLPAEAPAKVSLIDYAVVTMYEGSLDRLKEAWKVEVPDRIALYGLTPAPPAEDVEKLRRFLADKLYAFIYNTVKEADPNHLYLGSWIMPDASARDWDLFARHCDVIGYDYYAYRHDSEPLTSLAKQTDKPIICGQFSFPPVYAGGRGFGRFLVSATDDAEAGELYHGYVKAAARDPYCVGLMWFQYRDQPIAGRGPGRGEALVYGENFAEGLVTITDRPKWDLVARVREANLEAAKWRLEASKRK